MLMGLSAFSLMEDGESACVSRPTINQRMAICRGIINVIMCFQKHNFYFEFVERHGGKAINC